MSLNLKRENLSNSKIKLTIHLAPAEMRKFFAKVYNKLAPGVEVQGFRKGKAPKNLTIQVIGENHLMQEIINLALSDTYVEALKQEKIIPVSAPKVNIKMMKDLLSDDAELEYEAEIELIPDIKIGDYKKSIKSIKLLKPKEEEIKVAQEEVDQVLSHLQRQHATFEEIDRPAEDGDRVEIDFEGTEKGVVLENLTSKNYPVILGSKVLVPEFEKNIIGMKKGEEKEFDAEVGPAGKSAQGGSASGRKKVHFKAKMLDIKKVNLPVLDNELAKKFQQNTIEELVAAIQIDIAKQKEIAQKQQEEGLIVEALLKNITVTVPESLVDQEIHRMIDDLKTRSSMMGMPFEAYLAQIKKTEEDLHHDFHEQAEKTVKIGLILGEIGKLEKVDIKDKEAGRKVMDKLLEYAKK